MHLVGPAPWAKAEPEVIVSCGHGVVHFSTHLVILMYNSRRMTLYVCLRTFRNSGLVYYIPQRYFKFCVRQGGLVYMFVAFSKVEVFDHLMSQVFAYVYSTCKLSRMLLAFDDVQMAIAL